MQSSIPTELDNILPCNYEYKIVTFESKEQGHFSCVFRIKNIRNKEEILEWLNAFKLKSKVTWRQMRSYKCGGKKNLHRYDYRCHHRTLSKHQSLGKRITKNTNCQASMKIKILRFYDLPTAKTLVNEDTKTYPCEVHLHSWHNHCLNSASVLRFRDPSSATKEKLVHYFLTGHSVATARRALQTELLLQNVDEYDALAADSSLLPSASVIQHSVPKIKEMYKTDDAMCSGQNVVEDLENLIKNYYAPNSDNVAVQAIGAKTVVAMCTPIMKRTARLLPEVKKMVFLHVSESVDDSNHRVYFFFSPSIFGVAPIGCIVADAGSEDTFKAGVKLLKKCLPAEFKKGPAVFMAAEDLEEWKVLRELWPNSKLLLSQFYVLQAAWKWMVKSKKLIPRNDRQTVYFELKDLVFSVDEDSLNTKMREIQSNWEHGKISKYFKNMWETKHLWASCYREGIDEAISKYFDSSLFRISKDTILGQVKGHNIVQLVDFIIIKYELYLRQRYLDFVIEKESNPLLKEFLFQTNNTVDEDIEFNEERNCYIMNKENGESHFVDVDNDFCSCNMGYTGQLCKHIIKVIKLKNYGISPTYGCTYDARKVIHQIAVGGEEQVQMEVNDNSPDSSTFGDTVPTYDFDSPDFEMAQIVDVHTSEEPFLGSGDVKLKFEEWCEKVRNGLQNNPAVFTPAVSQMLSNHEKHASTEEGLLSALNNFAKY